jgi:hypothetical protein
MDGLKWLAVIASYIGLIVMLIGLGIKRIKKSTAQDLKIESHDEKFEIMGEKMEKDNKRHEIEIAKIHGLIEIVRKENNTQYAMYTKNNSEQHGKIFEKIETINNGISDIKGYLRAKQEE